MKHREDVEPLSKLVGQRALLQKDAEVMLKLPLIIIPNPVNGKYPEWEAFVKDHWSAAFLPEEELPLLDFMVMLDFRGLTYPAGSVGEGAPVASYYCRFTQIDHNSVRIGYTGYPQAHGLPPWWTVAVLNGHSSDKIKFTEIVRSGMTAQLIKSAAEKDPAVMDRALNEMSKRLLETYGLVSCFARFNNQQDRYLFSVTRNGKRKFADNREGKLARIAGPRVIYLDKLPTTSIEGDEFTGRSIASHQRRGHFKTLRADRYKNHPLYLVEKGIYIKPCWVGDRSTIVNGGTYMLMDRSTVGE